MVFADLLLRYDLLLSVGPTASALHHRQQHLPNENMKKTSLHLEASEICLSTSSSATVVHWRMGLAQNRRSLLAAATFSSLDVVLLAHQARKPVLILLRRLQSFREERT
jgi:hypothetical protein